VVEGETDGDAAVVRPIVADSRAAIVSL
jgi:hypothetical protein